MRRACSIILFIFLFLPLFWLAVFLTNIQFSVLNPKFIKSTLSKNNTYEKILAAIPQIMQKKTESQIKESGGEETGENIDPEMYQKIVEGLDPKWLESQSETVIDAFFAYLNSNEKNPQIEIDLTETKPVLMEKLKLAFEERYNSLPVCTEKEFKQNIETKKELKCKVPGMNFTEILNKYDTENVFETEIGGRIPEKINLADYQDNLTPELKSFLDGFEIARGVYKTAKLGLILLIIVSLLSLFAIAGIWKKKTRGFWATFGAFLGIAGVVSILDSANLYLTSFYFLGNIEKLISAQFPDIDLSAVTILQPLLADLFRKMAVTEFYVSLAMIISGFCLFYLLPKNSFMKEAEPKEETQEIENKEIVVAKPSVSASKKKKSKTKSK